VHQLVNKDFDSIRKYGTTVKSIKKAFRLFADKYTAH